MRVQTERCTGCGACVDACPEGAIYLVDNVAVIHRERCTDCGTCVEACPVGALVPEAAPLPVPVASQVPEVLYARPVATTTPRKTGLLPVLGTALAFAGREILPRLATYVLDLVDRQTDRSADLARTGSMIGSGKGRRLRWRKRGRR
ncbi:MAG: DUF362 domain-containing protein [Anaerolineae bacterium]